MTIILPYNFSEQPKNEEMKKEPNKDYMVNRFLIWFIKMVSFKLDSHINYISSDCDDFQAKLEPIRNKVLTIIKFGNDKDRKTETYDKDYAILKDKSVFMANDKRLLEDISILKFSFPI